MRSVEFGKSEVNCMVYCGYCGAPVTKRGAKKFCGPECYRQKRLAQPVEQSFWAKVDRSGECWLWTASRWNSGYGQFKVRAGRGRQRVVGAHVFSFELANGTVPDGLEVMHTCDTPLCVRPDHLTVGTHLQNVQDAAVKGRYRVSRPTSHKLTVTDIANIRSLVASGEMRVRVAKRFGISKAYVTRIMAGTARQYDAPLSGEVL
jgi:hypothetical protein